MSGYHANQQETKSNLESFTQELVSQAAVGKIDPVLNRDAEISRVIRILARRTKNNPVLIGPPGVGKTAIVEGLALRVVRGDVTSNLKDCKIFSLDMGLLVAGAVYRGQFEDRLKGLMKELKDLTEKGQRCVLFIDEVHLVLGAGKTDGAMDAANIMKPELSRAGSGLRVIGATTLDEYRRFIEKDSAFERRFQKVLINEPSVDDTISILRGLKEKLESHHGVHIKDGALVIAAQLADRYIQDRYQPDKSIDLVDEACAKVRVQLDSQPEVIDQLERKKMRLEVEQTALKKEKDSLSKQRLEVIDQELSKVDNELIPLKEKYQSEKSRIDEIQSLQQKLDNLKVKLEIAERNKDLAMVADLQYFAIPSCKEKLAAAIIRKERNLGMDVDDQKDSLLTETVGTGEIYDIVSSATGIPVTKLSRSDRDKILNLEDALKKRIVGQDAALKAISDAIIRSRAGISRPEQPLGSFLFLGPTGVGKTEVSKALAYELFDDERHMVRIDMSEYLEAHSVARLIGSPPGYVGHEEGGQLTEVIRRNPYNVILFDEVEKAHPQVLNVLLQLLDEGRLTDGQGRVVNFRNTIIIMTSNLGAELLINESNGFSSELINAVKQAARTYFRPELLNRIDELIVFKPLSKDDLYKVASLQLQRIASRFKDKDIEVETTRNSLDLFIRESYDPVYGARPMRRYLERTVVTDIGKMLIREEIPEHSVIVVDVKDGLLFYKIKSKTAQAI
ncbi:hypothetical protein Zmor_019131 [Zophobas morio]|jgi:ATP-dependent Clp protease ATP-binding subunit ClpB|uniref:Uncharacterized protein n=1 Tax=Zophobas morio TaxID=2755281 RepID=A0AA38M0Q4_9CUCU|nr:hypothetical protein Zmor_019131 [Zophobas morio]